MRNYKALSSMMTTDGITAGSKNATFEHCWIYCGDNALVISGAKDQIYRDIVIGTTCAAVFPQLDAENITLENIHVFRSNDGIVTNRYNNKAVNRLVSITFKNLDCMDCINVPRFFQGGNMGLYKKTFTFDGVSLPSMSGVTDPHKNSINDINNILAVFSNPDKLFTENYDLLFKNVYIGGTGITDASQVQITGEYDNTLTVSEEMAEDCEMFLVSIVGSGSPMEYFSLREFELIKK